MRPTLIALLLFATVWAWSCDDPPESHYEDFIDRADRTPPPVGGLVGEGFLIDPTGSWLFNISLAVLGEIFLELTVTFENYREAPDGRSALVDGRFTYPEDGPNAEPLATFTDTVIDESGRMELDLGFVRIEPERSPIEDTAVEVEFRLQAVMFSSTEMCGLIDDPESNVSQPIQIQLRGVTFGAQRYGEQGQLPVDVPTTCPPGFIVDPNADPDADVGMDPDAGIEPDVPAGPLRPPDVDLGEGTRADISGRFWMNIDTGVLPLGLMAFIEYTEDDDGNAFVEGSLRVATVSLAQPEAGSFRAPVDENGEFTVIVPDLVAASSLGDIIAEIALRASIKDADFWCGAAAGSVTAPIPLDLDGTTFGAARLSDDFPFPPTEEEPSDVPSACP